MITIKHLSKSYGKHRVLKNISASFSRYGLIAICGDSGCGKTTLLNCLSCLLDFEGEIDIDGVNLSKLKEEEKDNFRLKNIGFVFQDFKLFNSETVERNVLLPLEMSSGMKDKYKTRKVDDLLSIVGLSHLKGHKINQLSGGEKQRIAIARALVNDPKIILADEPTGALDSYNSEEIMKILEGISKNALIIVVSHDKELMKKYASQIINMKDGVISHNEFPKKEDRDVYLPIFKNKDTNKKPSIPSSFLMRHSLASMKEKKWRTIICSVITSLGLIGVGLAISLSSTISANIKKAYSQMIDDSKIVLSSKEKIGYIQKSAGGYYEAMNIASNFPEYVMDVGVNYVTDFESFFKSKNEFAIASTVYRQPIEGFSARNINEFKWLDFYKPTKIYPQSFEVLKDDEIVMGMNMPIIQDICLSLRIERSIDSLSEYLENNDLLIYLDVANNDWQYYDQQLFTLKGFVLESSPCIYHTNHLWNEYMLENRMRLPANDNFSQVDYYPWVLKKVYYFHTYGNTDDFLIKAEESPLLDEYLLDIADQSFYPWLYRNVDVKDRHRVMFYVNTIGSIPKRYADILIGENKEINSPIYGSYGGYMFYPSNMLSGFSHQTFFSFSEEQLAKVVDENSSLNLDHNEYTVLKDGVMVGHFSKTMNESVRFAPLIEDIISGTTPKNLDEIVISAALAKKLGNASNPLNSTLYLSYNDTEMLLEDGSLQRSFVNTQLRVCGIVYSDRYEIYHHSYWTINFFKSRLGVSAYDLSINTIAFNCNNTSETLLKKMNRSFPKYDVVNPMDGVNESVNEICTYIEIAMTAFSIIATIIASLLLTMCAYLHVLDSQKEIALSRCLGTSKKEAKKFVVYHTVLMCLISLVISIIEMIVISIVSSYVVANSFNSQMVFSFDIRGVIFMAIIALMISFVSSLWVSNKVGKLNPLDVLKK